MDKRVVFAVAGSGKTTRIIAGLDLERRFLLVTYTDNNLATLRRKVFEKFGFIPKNITLLTYFTFLHAFCYRPLLAMRMRTNGINFDPPPMHTRWLSRDLDSFYIDPSRRLYHNRIAKLLETKGVIAKAAKRVEKYFDVLCFDEVQDIGGHDFQLLEAICGCDMDLLLVGDFFQYTYTSSQDGNVNSGLHADYAKYKTRFQKAGLTVDTTALAKSHRCSATVSEFIREQMGIDIHSHTARATVVVHITKQSEFDELHACEKTVKLFIQEHGRYGCHSENWGRSKGQDHHRDVCVVLHQAAYKAYLAGGLREISPLTMSKLYVACSRASGNLYLVSDKLAKKFKQPAAAKLAANL